MNKDYEKNSQDYGSNRPPDCFSENSAKDVPSSPSGEYHLSGSDLRQSDYRDASYTNFPNAPSVPPRYHYSQQNKSAEKRARENRAGAGSRAIIALCLVFSLLGGAGGGIATYYVMDSAPANTPLEDDSISGAPPTTTPVSTAAPSPIVQSAGDTAVYTGAEIYALGCPQTVGITTSVTTQNVFGQTSTSAVTGSGFIIRENGYILTNYHVIETAVRGGYDIEVMLYNGESYIAEVIGHESDNDIAVLKIDAEGLPAAALGDSDALSVGETLYAIGNPLGELTYTLTSGLLSALDRDITLRDESTGDIKTVNMFQTSAAVNSGNSGGPVYNAYGEVVGVVTAKYSSDGVEGLGFAIPINDARYIADELITNGYVSGKAFFGITVQTVTAANAQYFGMPEGAYVASVTAGSCADKAGIKIGDVIIRLGDAEILSRADLTSAKKSYKAGDTAQVELFRAGETIILSVTFDEEAPAAADTPQQEPTSTPNVINPYDSDSGGGGNRSFPFFFGN